MDDELNNWLKKLTGVSFQGIKDLLQYTSIPGSIDNVGKLHLMTDTILGPLERVYSPDIYPWKSLYFTTILVAFEKKGIKLQPKRYLYDDINTKGTEVERG